MGKMTATCYHEVEVGWVTSGDGAITIKDYTRDGRRATSYRVVCPECKQWYAKEKQILYTKQDEKKWLRRGKNVAKNHRKTESVG